MSSYNKQLILAIKRKEKSLPKKTDNKSFFASTPPLFMFVRAKSLILSKLRSIITKCIILHRQHGGLTTAWVNHHNHITKITATTKKKTFSLDVIFSSKNVYFNFFL